ncbi:uncharacterized protein LOC105700536 isoform X2 [Orussus abietinus]|uniref:uncharacterized protein LOC105700536 isoform X2 n=1 Tax=Orussus abietinus TaxID=222816 RepID=UPI000625A559|nr:uncharacterized protein LOC105700536 isoform X2 [Orussus abietinus]
MISECRNGQLEVCSAGSMVNISRGAGGGKKSLQNIGLPYGFPPTTKSMASHGKPGRSFETAWENRYRRLKVNYRSPENVKSPTGTQGEGPDYCTNFTGCY